MYLHLVSFYKEFEVAFRRLHLLVVHGLEIISEAGG